MSLENSSAANRLTSSDDDWPTAPSLPTRTAPDSGWLRRTFGPSLNLKELNFVCWGLLLVGLILPLVLVAAGRNQSLDADFVYFYSMGRSLNSYPAKELYDTALQRRICTEVHSLQDGQYGPNPYPPFIAILFRPFALVPYPIAYGLWLSISLLLYSAGVICLGRMFFGHDLLRRSLMLCFSLAFYPFAIDTLVNGQLSTIGFFAIVMALRNDMADRPVMSGLALSVCSYKPTLLVLILPMLVITRRFRTLCGFGGGVLSLALLTVTIEGTGVWSGYVDILHHFGRAAAGIETHSFLRLRKYVDLTSFSSLQPGGRSWPGLVAIYGFACWASVSLLRSWWVSARAERQVRTLLWATTISWTLLINAYVPRHDSILTVISVIATLGWARSQEFSSPIRGFGLLVFLTFVFSWITDQLAQSTGIQTITLLLTLIGTVQLRLLRSVTQAREKQTLPAANHRI